MDIRMAKKILIPKNINIKDIKDINFESFIYFPSLGIFKVLDFNFKEYININHLR